jgi:16S rRNA (guanine(966)-N(2))-methyltransferase RsmD
VRIIAGAHRGRRIDAPPGRATRPMLDRMRESLFSILAPWLPGGVVLDLFAGSGSLGLEALSRGARSARLVERDAATVALIERNVAALGEGERTEVVRGDALDPAAWGSALPDVVFLDPPYPLLADQAERLRLFAAVRELLVVRAAPEAVLAFHAPRRALRAAEFGAELVVREREVGSGTLWFAQAEG